MSKGNNVVGSKYNDTVVGSWGDDTIDGGAGNDLLRGSDPYNFFAGNDTYIFGKKHGADTIASHHAFDQIYTGFASGSIVKMTKDVRAKDVKLDIVKVMLQHANFEDVPQWNLTITLKGGKDVLTIEDYLHTGKEGRGEIKFADGTSWTYADVISKVAGDSDFKDYVVPERKPLFLGSSSANSFGKAMKFLNFISESASFSVHRGERARIR